MYVIMPYVTGASKPDERLYQMIGYSGVPDFVLGAFAKLAVSSAPIGTFS
jgi:hypothetical protein